MNELSSGVTNVGLSTSGIRPPRGTLATALSSDAFLSLSSMEGVYEPVVEAPSTVARPSRLTEFFPGYVACAIVMLLAFACRNLPIAPFTITSEQVVRHPISTVILAILIGLLVRNLLALPAAVRAGCKHVIKKAIPVAIVCMGAGFNLVHLANVGLIALAITVACIAIAMLAGTYVGRLCGLNWKTALLLGTGTGICGNSAIVAVAPLIEAEDDDLVLSIGAVNLFGLLAMLAWPLLGSALNLSSDMFGVWSGTSIHAVPQVVAAGFAFSPEAGTLATLVKLVRVTMLAPLVFVLAILYASSHRDDGAGTSAPTVRYARLVPWFVWGFVLMAVLNTIGLLPSLQFAPLDLGLLGSTGDTLSVPLAELLTRIGGLLLTLAMAAIGLEVNLRALSGVGARAIQAGFLATLAVGGASLAMILLLM